MNAPRCSFHRVFCSKGYIDPLKGAIDPLENALRRGVHESRGVIGFSQNQFPRGIYINIYRPNPPRAFGLRGVGEENQNQNLTGRLIEGGAA
jgi:hypothetical protein